MLPEVRAGRILTHPEEEAEEAQPTLAHSVA